MKDGFTILARRGAQHQESHAAALAQGLRAHGIQVALTHAVETVETEHVACWGWRAGQKLRGQGKQVLVMERGYLGDRFAWTSLGWNGLNNFATFGSQHDCGARFNANFSGRLLPWEPQGRYVLLIGQVPGDMSLRGKDLSDWYDDQAEQAHALTGLPVLFRPHPMSLDRGYRRQTVKLAAELLGDLPVALAGAALVVTYNSNTAVDAVLAGKRTVVADAGGMAWDVCAHTVRDALNAPAPRREAWLHRLAWCQWTLDEISSGEAWATVGAVSPGMREAA